MCCFECCVKFISRQAYIQMALFGGGFCESAKHAFELVVRNAGTTAAVTMVTSHTHAHTQTHPSPSTVQSLLTPRLLWAQIGNVFSIMGVCLVMAITGVITFFIVEGTLVKPEGVSSPILPVLIALILAFAISKMFMTVLDMAINTILHCYVADTEAHDGVPVYLSSDSGLHAYVGVCGCGCLHAVRLIAHSACVALPEQQAERSCTTQGSSANLAL